jgi:MFS family permease
VKSSALPLLIALLPLTALSALQFALPVVAPLIMQSMGMAPEAFGVIAGTIGLGAVLFYVTNHVVTPAIGPMRTLQLGLLLSACGTVLLAFASGPLVYLGALMIGYGYGTTTPASSQVLADFTPKAQWGILFSIRQAGVPFGGMIAGVFVTTAATAYGWQMSVCALALVAVIIAVVFIVVPQHYNTSRPLRPFRPRELFSPVNLIRPLQYMRRVRGLTSLTSAACGFAVMHTIVVSFFVTFLNVDVGVPLTTAGGLFALLQASAIVGRILFGALADYLGSPLRVLKIQAPMSAASTMLLAMVSHRWPFALMAGATLWIGLTVGTWNGLFLAQVARIAPDGEVSDATAASGALLFLTYMIVPPLFGFAAATLGFDTAFILFAFAPITAYAILVDSVEPVRKDERGITKS